MELGFPAHHVEELAALLSRALGVELFKHQSPMDGSWYSDISDAAFHAVADAVRAGGPLPPWAPSRERVRLRENDTDPGYRPLERPGWYLALASLEGERAELARWLRALGRAELPLVVLDDSQEVRRWAYRLVVPVEIRLASDRRFGFRCQGEPEHRAICEWLERDVEPNGPVPLAEIDEGLADAISTASRATLTGNELTAAFARGLATITRLYGDAPSTTISAEALADVIERWKVATSGEDEAPVR